MKCFDFVTERNDKVSPVLLFSSQEVNLISETHKNHQNRSVTCCDIKEEKEEEVDKKRMFFKKNTKKIRIELPVGFSLVFTLGFTWLVN